jgi:hypothetical protein
VTRLYVDGPTVIRAVAAAVANLEAHVEEVDSLNVFPVPDGDTGSNMLATMRSALQEAERLPEGRRDLDSVAEALSRGALTGARGNSGVILSQIIRGMTQGADGRRRANGLHLAEGLRRGSEVAYGAVLMPVEGTILTVIRDAAEAAESAAGRQPHVEAVLADVISAAAVSVQRTPMLLPVLEDAGVVDSGGQGLYRLLEGTLQVSARAARAGTAPVGPGAGGHAGDAPTGHSHGGHAPTGQPLGGHAPTGHAHAADGHGYETEYLLASEDAAIDVDALREAVRATGDSVVVAGDGRLVRVHVHGERPDLTIAAGLRWGRLASVAIRDLDDQVAEAIGHGPAASAPAMAAQAEPAPLAPLAPGRAPAIAIVAVAQADGLAAALASFGARVVRPAHGARPSVGEIAEAVLAVGAAEVIVLPNDRDALLAAQRAAATTGQVRVEIVPTRNVAEGVAAAVAFDPGLPMSRNLDRMAAESGALRTFAVIAAARDSIVDGQSVAKGQFIALDAARRLLACEGSAASAALQALAQLGDYDLVTCYRGAALSPAEGEEVGRRIGEARPGVDVEIVPGGQRHDHLLIAVE